MARKSGLGRGLESLLGETAGEVGTEGVTSIALSQITPNPDQPRKDFDEEELSSLADSVRKNGVLQPILLRPVGDDGRYEIVAGERRFQAAMIAGLSEIPAVVRQVDDQEVLVLALVENLQRSDLSAMEEARGYRELIERNGFTQQRLAEVLSKSRSAIANTLRLLDLPEEVQRLVADGRLTAGHARAILSVEDEAGRVDLAHRVVSQGLSVRQTENLASLVFGSRKRIAKDGTNKAAPEAFGRAADRLQKSLETKVSVRSTRGKNRIEIEFKDERQLMELVDLLCGSQEP